MKIIAGLGNPGAEYARTRHNVGFMLVDALADKLGAGGEWRLKQDAMIAETRIGMEKVILMKPMTYMNESGRAVGPLLSWYKLTSSDLIVMHDDIDIPVGTVRIRKKGSAGGHNGMKSVLYHVGDENFARVRIGIGRPKENWTVINHVLSTFSDEEKIEIDKEIEYLVPAVECIVTDGIDLAMNRYNPKKQKNKKNEQEKNGEQGQSNERAENEEPREKIAASGETGESA